MLCWAHLLVILSRDTKTWRLFLTKNAQCVSLPGNTHAFCFLNHCVPKGEKKIYFHEHGLPITKTDTVQSRNKKNKNKNPVLRNTTTTNILPLWSLKKRLCALADPFISYLSLLCNVALFHAHTSVKSLEQWEQQKPAMMQGLAFIKLYYYKSYYCEPCSNGKCQKYDQIKLKN